MRAGDELGGYRLERPLGEGGMKQVWRARGPGGAPVALAVLASFDPERFVHEVTLARRVTSPRVARVLDGFVTDGGLGVVVSELCPGLDLARYRQARPVTVGAAVALVAELAEGLAAIHAAHVLHRDVKPGNAILTRAGVKVIDFGLSLPATDERTGPEGGAPAAAGTLPYLAPEAVTGEVDARTDTYALGVTLFHLIAGHPPLPFLSPYGWLARLEARASLPLDDLGDVPVIARAMVARLCAPERDRRPFVADVVDPLRALARSLDGRLPAFAPGPADDDEDDEDDDGDDGPARAAPPVEPPTDVDVAAPAATRASPPRSHPATMVPVPLATASPSAVIVGWPHLPLLALCADGGGTAIRGLTPELRVRDLARVDDRLLGGLVVDLDGDGVGELYAWSAARLHVLDAAGRARARHDLAARPGPHPWDDGAPAPVVLGDGAARALATGDVELDGQGALRRTTAAWEGRGEALVDAAGTTGLSAHGGARQRFRGDLATPAAVLTRRGAPGFVVAALERVPGGPAIRVGLWGPGGRRVGGGDVGRYALETAPLDVLEEAQRDDTRLFEPTVAPLAALGRAATDDTVLVPFLQNAPWFGPVLAAFDGDGRPRWREKLAPVERAPAAPPILVDLDGDGPQLVWSTGRGVERRDVATGAARPALRVDGAPVAALDLGGQGVIHLVSWTPQALVLTRHGACLPGAVLWLPTRGDLWRSGTLGPDGLPVGPRT